MRKLDQIILLSILFLIIFIFAVSAAVVPFNAAVLAADQNSYQVDVIRLEGGDYGYPSPYAHYPRGPGGYKMNLIFDSLMERGEDGLISWLAEDYEIKDEGREYIFTIRDDVKWHDGEKLTAEDIKFSFEYGLENPMVWSELKEEDIKEVKIIDQDKVSIAVSEINASNLYNIGSQRIIPKHIWKDVEAPKEYTEADAVVGTGPYILTDYSKEHGTYRFEAFADFWGPKQSAAALEFVPVSEAVMAFEQGDIDLIDVSPDLLARYRQDSSYKVVQKPAFWAYRLIFNIQDVQALKDKNVRQAVNYAVDKEELIEKIERGAGEAGSAGIIPPDHVFYNPEVKNYDYNPAKAEELLKEAGYDSLSLDLKVADRTVRMAELLKEQLARVGIEISIISSDTKTQDSRIHENEYELAITGHGGWGSEPDYLIERFVGSDLLGGRMSSSGAVGYKNEELDKVLAEQKIEFDEEKRKLLLYEAQEILAEDVPEIPLFYRAPYSVYRADKYDGWVFMYDHHSLSLSKLSYLQK